MGMVSGKLHNLCIQERLVSPILMSCTDLLHGSALQAQTP